MVEKDDKTGAGQTPSDISIMDNEHKTAKTSDSQMTVDREANPVAFQPIAPSLRNDVIPDAKANGVSDARLNNDVNRDAKTNGVMDVRFNNVENADAKAKSVVDSYTANGVPSTAPTSSRDSSTKHTSLENRIGVSISDLKKDVHPIAINGERNPGKKKEGYHMKTNGVVNSSFIKEADGIGNNGQQCNTELSRNFWSKHRRNMKMRNMEMAAIDTNKQSSEHIECSSELNGTVNQHAISNNRNDVRQRVTVPSENSVDIPQELVEYLKIKDQELDDEDEPLPLLRKICFAVGGAPYQICSTVIGFFLNIFLLEVAQIPPKYISIILFGGKAWDAISDPICGYLVNKTETRWGKMRPWILFSAPFACASYFFLWYVPEVSDEGKLGYYFVMFCVFECLLSGLHVPYTSLTMYISNNQKERDSATAFRMVLEAFGVLIGVIVQGLLIEKYRIAGDCENPDSTQSPTQLQNQKWSYMVGSGVVVAIYFVCAITVFLGVEEKRRGVADSRGDTSFFKGLKIVFTYGPYVKAAMVFLFLSLAVSIIQGNLALYCTHSLDLGKEFSWFIIVLLLVSIFFMPVWQLVLTRYGKKTAYAAGMILFIPILIGHLYLPRGNPYFYYVTVAVAGLSISVSLLLPWSVLPDVLDLFMLEKKTRKDALFYSFYVFFNKFSAGLGLAVSQLALQFGGYETGACVQPHSVDLTLRLLIVPGPVLCLIIALMFLWSYPIDENKRIQIKQEVLDIMTRSRNRAKDELERSTISYESIPATNYSTEL